MRWLHGAAYVACHLIRCMRVIPVPIGVYLLFHDRTVPMFRRLCECRPGCWCQVWQRAYNAAPAPVRLVLLAVTFPWDRR